MYYSSVSVGKSLRNSSFVQQENRLKESFCEFPAVGLALFREAAVATQRAD